MKPLLFVLALGVHTCLAQPPKRISITASNDSVKKVLLQLVLQCDLAIATDSIQWLQQCPTVSFIAVDRPYTEVLDLLLEHSPLTWSIGKARDIRLAPRAITGTIRDEDNQPVENITIQTATGDQMVRSDGKGQFTLPEPGFAPVIIVRAVNIHTLELAEAWRKPQDIQVKKKIQYHEAHVVMRTGYDLVPFTRASGSFTNISKKQLEARPDNNLLQKLEGVANGLVVAPYNPWLERDPAMTIRGSGTISLNKRPLIVVDRFPFEGNISDLNANDIQSVTLLKDAAAASAWGARAGNGVIVVTTRQGKWQQPLQASFSATYSVYEKPDVRYQPSPDAAASVTLDSLLYTQGKYTNALASPYMLVPPAAMVLAKRDRNELSGPEATLELDRLRQLDVRDDYARFYYRKSTAQQYFLHMSGGDKVQTCYFSLSYDRNRSGYTQGQYTRYTATLHHSIRPWKKVLLTNLLTNGNSMWRNNTALPEVPFLNARLAGDNDQSLTAEKDLRQTYKDQLQQQYGLQWNYVPLEEKALRNHRYEQMNYRMFSQLTWDIIKPLSVELSWQQQQDALRVTDVLDARSYRFRSLYNQFAQPQGAELVSPVPFGDVTDRHHNKLTARNSRVQLKYDAAHKKKDLSFSAIAGMEIRSITVDSSAWRTYAAPVNWQQTYPAFLNPANAQPLPGGATARQVKYHYSSFYANGALTVQRYTLTGSIRFDQSNLFGPRANQRLASLRSAGFKWDIASEPFYNSRAIPYLQARISYGTAGNIDNSAYALLVTQELTANRYGSVAAAITNSANPRLHWEKTAMWNAGINFSSRKEIISGSVDVYVRKGNGLLGFTTADPTTGVPNYRSNAAGLTGRGMDLELRIKNMRGVLTWQSTVLVNHALNKVSHYGTPKLTAWEYLMPGATALPSGRPPDAILSFAWAGLDPHNGNPMGYLEGKASANYSALLNQKPEALVYHGPASPRWTTSLSNTFHYKGLELYFLIMGQFGHYYRRPSVNYYALENNLSRAYPDFAQRWLQPGDEKTTQVPAASFTNDIGRAQFYQYASVLVERADQVYLRDVNLSWTLPVKWNASVFVYGGNLWRIWQASSYRHIDPAAVGQFPAPRHFSMGFKTSF